MKERCLYSVASDGLQALNLIREADRQSRRGGPARKKRYDVVLMDLEMPGEIVRFISKLTSSDGWSDGGA